MPPAEDRSAAIEAAAHALRTAAQTGRPIAPLRRYLDAHDVEGAYAVQRINTGHALAAGRRIAGYKIGLTSPALQQKLGIDEPDFGLLFEDMRIGVGGVLPRGAVQQPRVEGEIALLLARDILDPDVTAGEIGYTLAAALPAIEIVGSRIAGWAVTAADTIADNASAGAFVVGHPAVPPLPDLQCARMTLRIDGRIVGEGLGSAALGDPLEALACLARAAAARGDPLRAGNVILTGALAPMAPIPPGAAVQVEVEGLGSAGFRSEA